MVYSYAGRLWLVFQGSGKQMCQIDYVEKDSCLSPQTVFCTDCFDGNWFLDGIFLGPLDWAKWVICQKLFPLLPGLHVQRNEISLFQSIQKHLQIAQTLVSVNCKLLGFRPEIS